MPTKAVRTCGKVAIFVMRKKSRGISLPLLTRGSRCRNAVIAGIFAYGAARQNCVGDQIIAHRNEYVKERPGTNPSILGGRWYCGSGRGPGQFQVSPLPP